MYVINIIYKMTRYQCSYKTLASVLSVILITTNLYASLMINLFILFLSNFFISIVNIQLYILYNYF